MVNSITSLLLDTVTKTLLIGSFHITFTIQNVSLTRTWICSFFFLNDGAIWYIHSSPLIPSCFRFRRLGLRCPVLYTAADPRAWTWALHWATCNNFCVPKNFCCGRKFALHGSIRWQFSQFTWMLVHNVSTWQNVLNFYLLLGTLMWFQFSLMVLFSEGIVSFFVYQFFLIVCLTKAEFV